MIMLQSAPSVSYSEAHSRLDSRFMRLCRSRSKGKERSYTFTNSLTDSPELMEFRLIASMTYWSSRSCSGFWCFCEHGLYEVTDSHP